MPDTWKAVLTNPCATLTSMPLPVTFLDSNVAQVLIMFGEYVYDAYLAPPDADKLSRLGPRFREDVQALHDLAQLGTWYGWPIVVSPGVQFEHTQAPANKAHRLLLWDGELVDHHLTNFPDAADTSTFARAVATDQLEFELPVPTWDTPTLRPFPHPGDRRLLSQAIDLGCEVFLTMDYRSIWGPAVRGDDLPIRILRPCQLLQWALTAT